MGSNSTIVSFGSVVGFVSAKAPAKDAICETYISTENMRPNFGGIEKASSLPSSGSVSKFESGDTLFSNIRTYFKKVWQADFSGHCSNDVLILRTKDMKTLLPDYLYNLCRWEKFTDYSVRTSKGAKMPRGDKEALSQFEICLPPLAEQSSVVSILNSLDKRITLLLETNKTLESIAQAIFKSWFVDFDPVRAKMEGRQPEGMDEETAALFPDSFEESELGLRPSGWHLKTLNDAYEINPFRKLRKGNPSKYLDMANVPTQGFSVENIITREFSSGSKFTLHDTLLARITPCLENGKTAYVDFVEEGEIASGSTEFIVLKPKPPLPSLHAYLLCRSTIFREHAIKSMSGTSGRQRVQNDMLGMFIIAIPTVEIVEKFEKICSAIQNSITSNSAQVKLLSQLRDTLLPRLISGQLRLPEAQEQVEDALCHD
ncbi:MAG: restriction endonuclease subunit S [Alcaligenes nematophilus]|uniref:restriction endonuclease subunit S n=1 Tax=Alcaligenes nematophilus TaxID=2994643 RepID=UPI003D04FC6F